MNGVIERNLKGQFLPGNTTSKLGGNPTVKDVTRLKYAFTHVFTTEDVQALARELLDLCLSATDPKVKLAAIELLLNRLFGKPKEHVELTAGPPADLAPYSSDQLEAVRKILDAPTVETTAVPIAPESTQTSAEATT